MRLITGTVYGRVITGTAPSQVGHFYGRAVARTDLWEGYSLDYLWECYS